MNKERDMYWTVELLSGEEVDVHVDYEIDSFGYPASGPSWNDPGDPGSGPEFSISKIFRLDDDTEIKEEEVKPESITKLNERINELICEEANDPDDDYPEYD